jgi:hypothetical protein
MTDDENVRESARLNVALAPFTRSMLDGSGREVRLQLMPRTEFPGLGHQVGIRLETFQDGESIYEQTIGLGDEDRSALISALLAAGPRA